MTAATRAIRKVAVVFVGLLATQLAFAGNGPPRGAIRAMRGPAGVVWIALPAGSFMMGSKTGDSRERPAHRVTLKAFAMLETEVTVGQYKACVKAKACSPKLLDTWGANGQEELRRHCNWNSGRGARYPLNCVVQPQARAFCRWVGGRLPSEAEWEYAARSAGKKRLYPWGTQQVDCKRAVIAVTGAEKHWGCGRRRTWPVCSKPNGNTDQGLCDMVGNVSEWTADCYEKSYRGAPSDGRPRRRCSGRRSFTLRGGSYFMTAKQQRTTNRGTGEPSMRTSGYGFRCAKSL